MVDAGVDGTAKRVHWCPRYRLTAPELEDTASHLRSQYHRAIRDVIRRHWKEFLATPTTFGKRRSTLNQ
ncbi:hypothetical protein N7448_007237 [Penicillium atrosanguineum]|uniref:uncharacterized protein n=1 Tax=Penicillium atrosanguineum TaxID=1132637 RepID=UPI0023966EC8|nr:uncharacterized protein N7443_001736 [Penicillium atrosanguineum]KAJ5126458.1 hypothetical protein N7448_007237 [Penicillium atrosanguineum]KAJ5146658.1 hypothetical protein N7526_000010 [Penicillium atrosanguineum]KAJ5314852.1 hypothetical protein N7443_001736 [Penicillium atrosanguineum]